MSARVAVDSNVAIYAFRSDQRSERALAALEAGPVVSVQVMNEFVNVARRNLGFDWMEIETALLSLREVASAVVPVTEATHIEAVRLARRYRLTIYDALIAAAALIAGCTELLSEDMQHGLVIDGTLTIRNPFADA